MSNRTRRQVLQSGLKAVTATLSLHLLAQAGATTEVVDPTSEPLAITPPQIAFLSAAVGATALASGTGDMYYENMDLLEIRARMNSPLTGLSLQDARSALRDYDAAAVLAFTDEECAVIRGVIERMQGLLASRAPLYGRTPWSFIKLDDRAEGGMQHTRGPHIVLPRQTVEDYVKMHRELTASGTLANSPKGRNLLVHEQTHVLQRIYPALFEPLYTDILGFSRMSPAPSTNWLSAHSVINPDGPDMVWAFALSRIGGDGWVMPYVTLPDLPLPRMPQDFQSVGIEVIQTGRGWKVVEENGVPKRRDLDKIPGYDAHFPFPNENFHPAEITAIALAHSILQNVPNISARPMMPAIAAWATSALA